MDSSSVEGKTQRFDNSFQCSKYLSLHGKIISYFVFLLILPLMSFSHSYTCKSWIYQVWSLLWFTQGAISFKLISFGELIWDKRAQKLDLKIGYLLRIRIRKQNKAHLLRKIYWATLRYPIGKVRLGCDSASWVSGIHLDFCAGKPAVA